ncbi:HD domain-containing protein [Krasilnikovia sp. MM14-A1259]|uniref:HD domain-containing protein n=1 Tax=Krasilnikovia sp. MM14-A1259 TaxID=3373539 RepID=UPI003814F94D
MTNDSPERAASASEGLLSAALPVRWQHVKAVAAKAEKVGRRISGVDFNALVSAAWLHDVGYSPPLKDTGLHALDGARWLARNGFDRRVASLVAYHSCARYESVERGLDQLLLAEFNQEMSPTADALWYADMTTGPDGSDLTVENRLAEIARRYGPDDPVTRFWKKAEPELMEAVRRTEAALARSTDVGA